MPRSPSRASSVSEDRGSRRRASAEPKKRRVSRSPPPREREQRRRDSRKRRDRSDSRRRPARRVDHGRRDSRARRGDDRRGKDNRQAGRDHGKPWGSPQKEGCSLICRNLPSQCSAEELKEAVLKFSNVDPKDTYIPADHYTKLPKSFGFIEFDSPSDAAQCLRDLNGENLRGNELQVQEAKNGRKSAKDMRVRDRGDSRRRR